MKKALSLILVLALCVGLCACGGGNETPNTTEATAPQFDVANAITETPRHIFKEVEANQAKAMQNTYLFEVVVGEITDKYFEGGDNSATVGNTTYLAANNVRVCLPIEELAQLNKGETVAIVGKITEVIAGNIAYGNPTFIVFGEAQLYEGEISEVAPHEDEIFTGVLKGKNESYDGYWNIQIGDSNVLKLISFAEGEDLSAYNEAYSNDGQEITFTAYILGGAYQNAKIITD